MTQHVGEPLIMPLRPVFDVPWGERFQYAMRAYVEQLEMSLDDETIEIETLSGEPFCGCSDCYEREVWLMAVALTLHGVDLAQVRLDGYAHPLDHEAQRQMAQHGLAKNEVDRLRDVHDFRSTDGTCWVCGVDESTAQRTAGTYDA